MLVYVLAIGTVGSGFFIRPPITEASVPAVPPVAVPLHEPAECSTADSDWFVRELEHIRVTQGTRGNNVTFNALNARGKSIGKVTISATGDAISITAQFSDGAMKLIVVPGSDKPSLTFRGVRGQIIEQRLQAVSNILPQGSGAQAGWLKCSLTIVATVAACLASETGAAAVACVAGAGLAACECLPLVSDEFEDIEC